MKSTLIKLSLSLVVIGALFANPSPSHAALADWQHQVTSVGAPPSATVFTTTSGSSPALVDVGPLSGDRSFEFIVNAGLGGASSAFLGTRAANGNQGLKFEQWQDANVYGLTVFGVVDIYSTTAPILNTDTHVAFVSDGTAGTDLYVNGALVHSFTGTPLALTGMQGLAGISESGSATFFDVLDGNILGFASYDSALSAAEVSDHYNSFAVIQEARASIGLNFAADEPPGVGSSLAPSDNAGVVPRDNWNNLTGANGSAANLVKDVAGTAFPTSVSVQWSSPNTWSSTGRGEENNGFPAGPNRTLMTGYLDTTELASGAATVTISGLGPEFTTGGYDVIVYALGGVGGRGGGYTIGSTTKIGTAPSNPSTFVEDPGVDMTDVGDYLRFNNLRESSFTLRADASLGNFRAPINGLQILARPCDITETMLPPGSGFPGAGSVARFADDGTGTNCVVHLTDVNQPGAFGVLSIPAPGGGANVDNLHLHWRSLVGGDDGSVCNTFQFNRPGADGYSMSWGTDLPNPPSYGNPGEEGAGTGLIVAVDTFDNGGGEAPGLEIKWRGARVAFDNIHPDPGVAKDFLRKGAFVDADLTVDSSGQVSFNYDGRLLTATLADWKGISGGSIMFGARTGGACDNQWIDDLLIENYCPVPPGTSFPGVGNVARIADDGTGNNCVVHLTDVNQGSAFGVWRIRNPVLNGNGDSLHLHWRSLVGGDDGSVCNTFQFDRPGADGYSMSWGTDLPNPPSYGNPGEEGAGTGLIVAVDTFDNGGGEAPGLEIKWRGARVAFDNIHPDPGLAKDFLRKGVFVDADLTVDPAGQVTFTYDGRVLTAALPDWTGIPDGSIMFGGRTGGACDNQWIDDLLIEGGPGSGCGGNLRVARSGANAVVTWNNGGILQSSPTLAPANWTVVPGNPAGSYVTSATGPARFFRVCCSLAALSTGTPGVTVPNPGMLLSAVPLVNRGTGPAENVTLTAITLTGGTLISPAVPINLGTIPANGSVVLSAEFSGGPFIPLSSYALTVRGTYSEGTTTYPFTLAVKLVIPPNAPGEAGLSAVIVAANRVEGAPFPPQPLGFSPEVNPGGPPVPTGPFVPGTPTPNQTGSQLVPLGAAAAAAGPPPVVFLANNGLGLPSGNFNGTASTTAEPSGASGGGVIFAAANWVAAYSTDGGVTFTRLDPTTVFPNDAVGFCCDQIVQYVPSINRFIWLLQGNGYRLASASPQDIINSGGTAWTYWNLTPNVFGGCSGFDYPALSVGNNSLYLSWDAGFGGCSGGFQVVRTSLAGIQAAGTITLEFTDPALGTMAWGSHVMQNTLDEVFWAGHNNNSQMRVFSLAEGSGVYFWRDVGISSWANNAPTSITPDGQDWLAKNFNGPGGNSFPRNGIIGATRSGNQLWFAWTAGTDRNFQQAHVEMVTLDRGNNFRVLQQVQIWNNSYAFAYPALATACTGEVGLSLEYGGNGNYENHVVGFWGDFIVYITSASNVGTSRFGDYVTLRQAPYTRENPGNLFTAFGYGLNSVPPPGTGTRTDIRYVLFGRPASWCMIGGPQ